MKKYFAFTLAEVIITLGIIGIVSAMTMPMLMSNIREKQTVSRLKQTYSLLSQAFKLAENDGADVSSFMITESNGSQKVSEFMDALRPHLKILSDCGLDDKNEVCVRNQYYVQLNNKNRLNYAHDKSMYKLVLANGTHMWLRAGEMSWTYTSGNVTEPELARIYVDTNGVQGPNQWGRDFFMFHYFGSLGLIPSGKPGVREANSCKLSSTGIGCAYYVLKNGNMDYLH